MADYEETGDLGLVFSPSAVEVPPPPVYRSGASVQSAGFQINTVVLPKPSGTVQGDLLIAFPVFTYGLSTDTRTINPGEAGWTLVRHSNLRLSDNALMTAASIFIKVAGASEAANYFFDISNSDASYCLGVIMAIRNASGVDASAVLSASTVGAILQTPSVTGLDVSRLDVRYALSRWLSHTHTAPATYTLRDTTMETALNCRLSAATKTQDAPGAYGAQNFGIVGTVSASALGFSVILRGPLVIEDSNTASLKLIPEHWDVHDGSGTTYNDPVMAELALTGSAIDALATSDSAIARLTFTPSATTEYIRVDAATALLVFTPITEHECLTRFVLTVDVLAMNNRWSATNTFNKFNNATSRNKYYVTYVGVDPSVSDC